MRNRAKVLAFNQSAEIYCLGFHMSRVALVVDDDPAVLEMVGERLRSNYPALPVRVMLAGGGEVGALAAKAASSTIPGPHYYQQRPDQIRPSRELRPARRQRDRFDDSHLDLGSKEVWSAVRELNSLLYLIQSNSCDKKFPINVRDRTKAALRSN